jgi:flavodoxin
LKSLVVYYTRTGNARFVAETIAAEVGADIEEVIDLKKRSGILGWLRGGSDARKGKETEIVVGTPIWAGKPTPGINTYLKKNDLSGKKVAAFFSQGGKKLQGIDQVKALVPNSIWIGELSITNSSKNKEECKKQITEWCKTLSAK